MNKTALRRFIKNNQSTIAVFILLVIEIITGSLLSKRFLTLVNIGNILEQMVGLGIVAIAQAMIILTGGIDLSLGALVSAVSAITSIVMENGIAYIPVGVAITLVLGAAFGFANGWGITTLKVPPFAMTLASMTVLNGVALFFRPAPGGSIPYELTKFFTYRVGKVFPVALIIMVALFIAIMTLLGKTRFGRNIYAVGGNERSAQLSGINTKRVKLCVYTMSGLLAAFSGLYLTARMGSGDPRLGDALSLDSVTVCVLGGLSLLGGEGRLSGVLGSTFVIAMLSNVLNLARVHSYWQYTLKGIVLIAIVVIYAFRDRKTRS